uniref:Uncharacterized protein n=1 Tax=Arundo donax TaxID=35708 RepID=A0A0A9SMB7_ARUDO
MARKKGKTMYISKCTLFQPWSMCWHLMFLCSSCIFCS